MRRTLASLLIALAFYWWFVPVGASYRIGPFGTITACWDAQRAYQKQGIYGSCQLFSD
jgi:hypothetical protein